VVERAGYTRPHTIHCGPEGIYVAALGNREGKGPGGVFLMDHETFDVRGQSKMDRGAAALRLRCGKFFADGSRLWSGRRTMTSSTQ
jgi:hypothetical protein